MRAGLDDDGARPRLTTLFRFPLLMPHIVWAAGWGALAVLAAVAGWLAGIVLGRVPRPLHRFLAAYVRYLAHVQAFALLVARPFPGFTGTRAYPFAVETPPPGRQRRAGVAFRLLLALPALLMSSSLSGLAFVAAVLGWLAALATGRMPGGLQRAAAWATAYGAQVNAYVLLVTPAYPYSGPPVAPEPEPAGEAEAVAAA